MEMTGQSQSKVMPVLVLTVGGVLLLGLTFMGYYGVVLLGERFLKNGNPQDFPMDQVRFYTMVGVWVLYLLLTRVLKSDLLKSLLLISPLTMLLVVVVLRYYMKPFIALAIALLLFASAVSVLRVRKKSWMYYYAVTFSLIIALFYAWPR